jgi:type IV pilus assembly protein PilQ
MQTKKELAIRTRNSTLRPALRGRTRGILMLCLLAIAAPAWSESADQSLTAAVVGALAPDEVRLGETGLLDVHVRDMEIASLLEMLSYQARANIVTSTSVTGRVSANLYAVNLEQALEAILTPNRYVFRRSGGTIFVATPEEIAALAPPPVTRVFKLCYIQPVEAAAAIKAVLGPNSSVVEGGKESTSGKSDSTGKELAKMGPAGVDYVIVTASPSELEAVAQLLSEIDQRPRQVLVEATILRATLNETNELGIDFTLLGGVDFRNVSSTSNAAADLQTGQLPPSRFEQSTLNVNTAFTQNVQGGGLTVGIINNSVAFFIRALEETTDVAVVANPKTIALNKQEGEVIVGRRDGYLTTTVTETAAIQTVEFLETGTQIRFRPVINDDNTVRLSVHPKDSNGGLTGANLPFEETTEARADLLVNDGGTVLIGGLFRERTVGGRSQIPVLGDIPLAGALFGSRNNQTVREEVIILLTVHVLKDTPQEHEEFRRLLEDVERIRVGSRQGLMCTGRERLAQAFYHEALRQLEQGDCDRALLNVRMALHNEPKLLPAIKLKEELLCRRMWDKEGGRMRTFIWDLIRSDAPPDEPLPDFARPQPELELPQHSENECDDSQSANSDYAD